MATARSGPPVSEGHSQLQQAPHPAPGEPRPGSAMDRFIDGIEITAAVFIGIVAADVFITVLLRYFGVTIPDSYDFGQLLLGILIFWGIAATSYRGTHITVDLIWANVDNLDAVAANVKGLEPAKAYPVGSPTGLIDAWLSS